MSILRLPKNLDTVFLPPGLIDNTETVCYIWSSHKLKYKLYILYYELASPASYGFHNL
jgi:hypothetical protein